MLKVVSLNGERVEEEGQFKYPQHDLVHKGKKFQLSISKTLCGYDVEYIHVPNKELDHPLFGKVMLPPSTLMDEHICVKGRYRFMFWTNDEKRIKKAIDRMKSTFRKMTDSSDIERMNL